MTPQYVHGQSKLVIDGACIYRGGGSVLGISACHAVLDAESLIEVGLAEHKMHNLANCLTGSIRQGRFAHDSVACGAAAASKRQGTIISAEKGLMTRAG